MTHLIVIVHIDCNHMASILQHLRDTCEDDYLQSKVNLSEVVLVIEVKGQIFGSHVAEPSESNMADTGFVILISSHIS